MMFLQHDIACCISILFILSFANANFQDFRNSQHRAIHLPEEKFGINEYSEDVDNDERDKRPLTPQWDDASILYYNKQKSNIVTDSGAHSSDVLDKNIISEPFAGKRLKYGQISAVSIDPDGHIAIFHRGSRTWGATTFDNNNRFDPNNGPIPENTLALLDKEGTPIHEWGKNMFYLPHGLTVDTNGNYWITDVAMHQVFKFDAKDLDTMRQNKPMKPSLILGEAFEPGRNNDKRRFCKPTAVAVQSNGDFFVSDGYCNSRIIKFNAKGEEILQWGRHWGDSRSMYLQMPSPYAFYVPHALALASEMDLIFVADRENGRIVSFLAHNGTFHKEYKHPAIGTKIYSVAYARERLYLINGPDQNSYPVRGFVLDVNTGDLLSQFAPDQNMYMPHDIAVTDDGSEIYVVELNIHTIYKFTQHINASVQTGNLAMNPNSHHEPTPLRDSNFNDPSTGGTTTATLVLTLVTTAVICIPLCVAIAAVVSRCQKRGCLLIMRKKMRWEAKRRDNFKLSSLLESRRGKSFKILEKRPNPRDFSKLNTEPETSEDEHPENSLAKVI